MANAWALSALWVGLALVATLLAIWFKISTALSEIVVGTVAQLVIGAFLGHRRAARQHPVDHLSRRNRRHRAHLPRRRGTRSRHLQDQVARGGGHRAGGLLRPVSRLHGRRPLLLGWASPSWLCGVALSTTSVAVVYAVMLELGFNVTEYGKSILAACFINDLGTVIALGLIFSPIYLQDAHICRGLHRGLSSSCRFSLRGFSENTAAASPSSKPNTSSSFSLPWAAWPCGPAVKRCFRPT